MQAAGQPPSSSLDSSAAPPSGLPPSLGSATGSRKRTSPFPDTGSHSSSAPESVLSAIAKLVDDIAGFFPKLPVAPLSPEFHKSVIAAIHALLKTFSHRELEQALTNNYLLQPSPSIANKSALSALISVANKLGDEIKRAHLDAANLTLRLKKLQAFAELPDGKLPKSLLTKSLLSQSSSSDQPDSTSAHHKQEFELRVKHSREHLKLLISSVDDALNKSATRPNALYAAAPESIYNAVLLERLNTLASLPANRHAPLDVLSQSLGELFILYFASIGLFHRLAVKALTVSNEMIQAKTARFNEKLARMKDFQQNADMTSTEDLIHAIEKRLTKQFEQRFKALKIDISSSNNGNASASQRSGASTGQGSKNSRGRRQRGTPSTNTTRPPSANERQPRRSSDSRSSRRRGRNTSASGTRPERSRQVATSRGRSNNPSPSSRRSSQRHASPTRTAQQRRRPAPARRPAPNANAQPPRSTAGVASTSRQASGTQPRRATPGRSPRNHGRRHQGRALG